MPTAGIASLMSQARDVAIADVGLLAVIHPTPQLRVGLIANSELRGHAGRADIRGGGKHPRGLSELNPFPPNSDPKSARPRFAAQPTQTPTPTSRVSCTRNFTLDRVRQCYASLLLRRDAPRARPNALFAKLATGLPTGRSRSRCVQPTFRSPRAMECGAEPSETRKRLFWSVAESPHPIIPDSTQFATVTPRTHATGF